MRNFEIAVVGIVEHKGNILIGKKQNKQHFLSGGWHIPGGKINKEENYKKALKRELLEETGCRVKILKQLDEKLDSVHRMIVKWYLCTPITFKLKAGDDLKEIKFVPKERVLKICDARAIAVWPPKVINFFQNKN